MTNSSENIGVDLYTQFMQNIMFLHLGPVFDY